MSGTRRRDFLGRFAAACGAAWIALTSPSSAQWTTNGEEAPAARPAVGETEAPSQSGTTDIQRSPDPVDQDAPGALQLVALLTVDGQQINEGLIWRVYKTTASAGGGETLIGTHREASPALKLKPGDYMINAAFGRAHLTRKILVKPGQRTMEPFVLNAGGLKLSATIEGADRSSSLSYGIYSDEKDQFDNRALIVPGAKPGAIYRLNAGLYQIVSRYGDANAIIKTGVTVEAGKMTEVAVAHTGALLTFKLVTRAGGEAIPDTHWAIQTAQGELVKESQGALPSHILAPGVYSVQAKSGGRAFSRTFTVTGGEPAQIEVVMR